MKSQRQRQASKRKRRSIACVLLRQIRQAIQNRIGHCHGQQYQKPHPECKQRRECDLGTPPVEPPTDMGSSTLGAPPKWLGAGEYITHRGLDKAGEYHGNSNAIAFQQWPHRIRPRLDRRFARAIRRRNRHAAQCRDRRNHRNSATPPHTHELDDRKRRMYHAMKIRFDDAQRALTILPITGMRDCTRHPCIGDEQVDRMRSIKLLQPCPQGLSIAYVDLTGHDVGTLKTTGCRAGSKALAIATEETQHNARLRVSERECAANPRTCPRDHNVPEHFSHCMPRAEQSRPPRPSRCRYTCRSHR